MSELLNDKKIISDGREKPLENAEASLRDQIVKKLFNKLEELTIGIKVASMWHKGVSERALWNERQRAWLSTWDEHLMSDNSGPFDGSSQLHIPMPFQVCKTLHSRFLQAIWQDPPFNVKAQNEASIDSVSIVRDVMRYYIMRGANYNKGIGKVVDAWVWDWITQGSGLIKARWDVQYSRYLDVEDYMEPGTPQIQQDENGNEILIPTMKPAQREKLREKKCFDGPVFDLVDLEDLLIIGGEGDPDTADSVIHRDYLTASQLWTLVDRKIFNKEAVEKVIESGLDRMEGSVGNDMKMDRARNAGQTNIDSEHKLDRYEILEAYLKLDVDGSGINSDVIVWVHNKSKTILHATYLYRISSKGERPFCKIDFQPRKGQEYAVGMVELLYPLSKEMDAIHNMRIDFGMISVMPFGFYRASSSIDPETIQMEPGALIPVDNPQTDVYFPNMGNRTSFGFQEEAALQNMIERLSSVNDLSMGMMSSQGATRTATGARALVGEMSSNLDVYLRRLNWGWEKLLRYLLDMLQQRIPQGLAFRLTGDSGAEVFRKLNSAKEIQGDFDIEVSPNSASSNQQIQIEQAQQITQVVSNPLAIQLGIVTPVQFYNAFENLMRAIGVKDHGKYLNKPQGNLRTMTPEEEANRLLRGMDVPVTPEMDHQGYLAYFQEIINNDELLGQFNESQTIELARQAKKHEQMLAALQQMEAQRANAMQMNQNAQMAAPSAGAPVAQSAPVAGGE